VSVTVGEGDHGSRAGRQSRAVLTGLVALDGSVEHGRSTKDPVADQLGLLLGQGLAQGLRTELGQGVIGVEVGQLRELSEQVGASGVCGGGVEEDTEEAGEAVSVLFRHRRDVFGECGQNLPGGPGAEQDQAQRCLQPGRGQQRLVRAVFQRGHERVVQDRAGHLDGAGVSEQGVARVVQSEQAGLCGHCTGEPGQRLVGDRPGFDQDPRRDRGEGVHGEVTSVIDDLVEAAEVG